MKRAALEWDTIGKFLLFGIVLIALIGIVLVAKNGIRETLATLGNFLRFGK